VDYKNGSSALLTVLLISILMSIAVFGFIVLISNWDDHSATFRNDSVNLTGIDYNSVSYNATNATVHGLTRIAPGLIWFILIFFVVIFLTLLALALKGH